MQAALSIATRPLLPSLPLRSMQPMRLAWMTKPCAAPARVLRGLACLALLPWLAGCQHILASTNLVLPLQPAAASAPLAPTPAPPGARATFAVDGSRGQPKALVYLALSGGGSRSAYMGAGAMLRLAKVDPEIDFLAEVDVLSAVSGGSMAAAFYAGTRDESLWAPDITQHLLRYSAAELAPLRLSEQGLLSCDAAPPSAPDSAQAAQAAPATATTAADVLARLSPPLSASQADRVTRLCHQAALRELRAWIPAHVPGQMKTNFFLRGVGNMLWPLNIGKYWFTAFDRSDIMAQTLADNLYDTPVVGRDLSMADLNPTRPYLLINATNATQQEEGGPFPFGSTFTFTHEDFRDRIQSDVQSYSLARAVMASSTFPLVFANMTLRDWRGAPPDQPEDERRFLHVFDGGNSDNLGLRAIKRSLLQLHADDLLKAYDRIVVLLVDAFTVPSGAPRDKPNPRGLISYLVDTNITDAVDSLLQANRTRLVSEFDLAELRWNDRDCRDDSRNLPPALCTKLLDKAPSGVLRLKDQMVFYHLGFADVLPREDEHSDAAQERRKLKARLDDIATSLQISEENAGYIDAALDHIIKPQNLCLQHLKQLLLATSVTAADVQQTRCACVDQEGRKVLELPAEPAVNAPSRPLMCATPQERR